MDKSYLLKAEYTVRDLPLGLCQKLVREYHYAGGGSNTATYCHGLFSKVSPFDCLGAAWWIPPTKHAAISSWDGDWQKVISLSRLVLVPEAPKNAASFLIAQSIKRIRVDGRFQCLITYADQWQGHTGAIYKATNWEYLGLTEAKPCWVDKSGRLVATKAGPRSRTRAEMQSLGYTVVGNYSKHKFRLILKQVRPLKTNSIQLSLSF